MRVGVVPLSMYSPSLHSVYTWLGVLFCVCVVCMKCLRLIKKICVDPSLLSKTGANL